MKNSNKRFLRKQEFFKNFFSHIKKYFIWADTGSHFRCAEFYHYIFSELASENIMVNFNLFGEQHGKVVFKYNTIVFEYK